MAITLYQCEHCDFAREDLAKVEEHEVQCPKNSANRACDTCEHCRKAWSLHGSTWRCYHVANAEGHYLFDAPVVNCVHWEQRQNWNKMFPRQADEMLTGFVDSPESEEPAQ